MSLQVWLPLNGTLENNGISDATVTNNGATVNTSGKTGSCYSFDGVDDYFQFSNLNIDSKSELSIAFWCKINGSNMTGLFVVRQNGSSQQLTLYSNALYFRDSNHSSLTSIQFEQPTQGVWTHYVIVYDHGSWIIYKNGSVVKRQTYSSANLNSNMNEIRIGRYQSSSGNEYYNGYLDDFRIYDHCLSEKEVSDIANSLVLHYELNGSFLSGNVNLVSNGWGGTENWANTGYSTTEIPSTPAGITHSYFNNTTKEFIPIYGSHSYTMSSYVKKKSSSASYCYLALIPYDVDKKQISFYQIADGFRASSLTTLSQDLVAGDTVIHLTDASGWANPTTYQFVVAIFGYRDSTGYVYPDLVYTRRCYTFGTTTDKSNLDIENNTVTLLSAYSGETIPAGTSICLTGYGATYYYPTSTSASNATDWTLLSRTFTPKNINYLKPARYVRVVGGLSGYSYEAGITLKDNTADSVVYDSSGYCNNGTITGTIGSVVDSPRYDRSTTFNGTSYIQVTSPSTEIRTVTFWAKWNSIPSGQSVVFVDQKSKIGFGLMSTGILCSTNGVSTHTFPKTGISAGTWYHFAIVNTSSTPTATTRDLYINGVKQTPTSSTSNWTYALDYLQLGKRSTTSDGFSGKISDFRMYTTALSAEDIMDLYSTSAYIHNTGTVSGFEITESAENLLKYENTVLYTKPTNTDTRGKYTIRNGEVAMAFRATDTYYGSGDERNGKLLYGFFKQNTSYVFDLWMDMDDVIYQDINRVGGFTIVYTDGTTETTFQLTGSTNPYTGWQHRVLVTNPNKTVKSISIYYWINSLFYVRSDSFIVEASQTDISKNGIIRSGQFVENTDVANIGRATFNTNKIIEI